MGKLLLTSSQVQVIASSFVIILCTFALFFSGYMIQQRTLRELRVAIQPRGSARASHRVSQPSSQAYLPERFRTTTTELEDGTIVEVESQAEREAKEQQVVVEVKQTKPDRQADKVTDHKVNPAAKQKNIDIVEGLKAKVVEKMTPASRPDIPVKEDKPLTRAQRRKMIKEDLQRSAQLEQPAYYQRRMW
ncbi:hypothetical protein G7Z17_g6181 [Cylindrodendrum hubeiense]|uniref:Uncharacterized protein n=1 Tax=Cylindrodendrum hubeiense TaxID=595255 RepID=A0A9P5H5A1_9HYPO|nr:hypothetical protein G7Z17_g6181 [Cylindrodendrum hubeiense]